jgi:hypothetical protein
MFPIGLISIVVLAAGYWVTLWLMGRQDDVLHGDFVHAEPETETAAESAPSFPPFPTRAPFPAKPSVTKPSVTKSSLTRSSGAKPAVVKRGVIKTVSTEAPGASPPASPAPSLPERSDTLQALLASIKQDLKDASQL